jgi:hypothetical protein
MWLLRAGVARPSWMLAAGIGLASCALFALGGLARGKLLTGMDSIHYYAVARSLVFDGDVNITNDLPLTPNRESIDTDGDGILEGLDYSPDGRIRSKFALGLSVAETPFLALGRGARALLCASGVAVSASPGYSVLEQAVVGLGVIALLSIGFLFLGRSWSPAVSVRWLSFSLAASWAGSSLLFYASAFPYTPHGLSFTLMVAIVAVALSTRNLSGSDVNTRLCLLGLLGGLLFLVRPQQVIIGLLVVPWLLAVARSRVRLWLPGLLLGVTLFGVCLFCQGLAHLDNFGQVRISGYTAGGEGFDWFHPKFIPVFFGLPSGMFLYNPITLLALVGFVAIPRAIPAGGWVFFAQHLIQCYVVACWSSPEQGEAFGARMLSDNAMAIAAGLCAFDKAGRRWRILFGGGMVACVLWTLGALAVRIATN